MKVESVSWNKNILKMSKREKILKCVRNKEKNTNWNSYMGSVKENDELHRKDIK